MYALDLKGAPVSFEFPVNPYPDLAKSHYAAASRVPLIQSPSLRVPRPVSNNTKPESPQILPTLFLTNIYGVLSGRTPTGHPPSPREHKRIRKFVFIRPRESYRFDVIYAYTPSFFLLLVRLPIHSRTSHTQHRVQPTHIDRSTGRTPRSPSPRTGGREAAAEARGAAEDRTWL